MRRDDPGRIMELPEVRQTVHPKVECVIHPGNAVGGVALCAHVIKGAAVFIKAEPDQDRWGEMLCEECAGLERAHLRLRLACVKCVRYHFFPEEEMTAAAETLSDRDLLSIAEKEGLRAYHRVRDDPNAGAARCPFESPELRWAWNLGFRLGSHLDIRQ